MIEIDGSHGEGGGQVLRTSLALSMLTRTPFRIRGIRKGRKDPGLKAQHLTGALAAARLSNARIVGCQGREPRIGDTNLEFQPGEIEPGEHEFLIPTAGSTSLLLAALYLPLLAAPRASTLVLGGGTHVTTSPTHDYTARVWARALAALGARVSITLDRAGFYPRGGGRVRVQVEPWTRRTPIEWTERGEPRGSSIVSIASQLPEHVPIRQADRLEQRIAPLGIRPEVEIRHEIAAPGKGSAITLALEYERGLAGFSAIGEPAKRAEQVGEEAARPVEAFLASRAALDPHLADQILLPLALVPSRSRFTTSEITRHLTTNAHVVRAFLPVQIDIEGTEGGPGVVTVAPGAPHPPPASAAEPGNAGAG